jgi:hypothetical protein
MNKKKAAAAMTKLTFNAQQLRRNLMHMQLRNDAECKTLMNNLVMYNIYMMMQQLTALI